MSPGSGGPEDQELLECVPRLLRAARSMGHSLHESEDLVHDALVEHLRARSRFRGDCSLYTWLYGILARRHVDRLRRRDTVKKADPIPPPSHASTDPERAQVIQAALDRLAEPYQTVLRMRFIEAFAYEEIARLRSVPVGTLKSQVFYGLQKLREILGTSLEAIL